MKIRKRRWLRALEIAKILFEDQGYFTDYLCEIETFIKGEDNETKKMQKHGKEKQKV
ncbi:hypothetical protein ES705_32712 [subsurface metagenome]